MALAIDITDGYGLSNKVLCELLVMKSKVRNAIFAIYFAIKAV